MADGMGAVKRVVEAAVEVVAAWEPDGPGALILNREELLLVEAVKSLRKHFPDLAESEEETKS